MKPRTEAIILAGGLGTRLRTVVSDLPKCMAPVNGKPFLSYLITQLQHQGVTDFIFSVGYMHEIITGFIRKEFAGISSRFSVEKEPLGTGGAIRLACELSESTTTVICNGDTFFDVSVQTMLSFHHSNDADCTLALKPMENFDRYGVVEINRNNTIVSFKEKQWYKKGLINGGVFVLDLKKFSALELPPKFSFEKDYLEKYVNRHRMFGLIQEGYFIDIGIPEDYERAQTELARKS